MTTFALFDSSALVSASYNRGSQVLRLRFVKGDVYDFKDVPVDVFNELIVAESSGDFFNSDIRPHYMAQFIERKD